MIKQFIYISAALAISATLAGCTENDEPAMKADPARYITFAAPGIDMSATVGGFNSRASELVPLDVSRFKVWGFCRGNGTNGQPSDQYIDLNWNLKYTSFTDGADVENLNGNVVTIVNDETTYNSGTFTKWLSSDDPQYTFIAVTDYDLDNLGVSMEKSYMSTNATLAHGPRLTVTLPVNYNDITEEQDYASQPDLKMAWTFDKGPSDSPIELNFRHIMTGIRFRFQNLTNMKLRVTGVTYAGRFYKQALFKFDSGEPVMSVNTDQTYACTFKLLDSQQEIPANATEYMGADAGEPVVLRLLPNPAGTMDDSDGKYTLGTDKLITINYQREIADNEWSEVKTFTLADFTLGYTPRPNTLHTATFDFIGDGFVTMFETDFNEHWESGSDSNITIH